MKSRSRLWALFLVCLLFILLISVAGTDASSNGAIAENPTKETNLTSDDGIEFNILINYDELVSRIVINNPTEYQQYTGIVLRVDEHGRKTIDVEIEPGERITRELNIRRSIHPLRDTHNITISTFGDSTTVSFERDVDLSDPGSIPIPQITDVRIGNDTVRGEPSAVAYVTVVNPTNQLYSMKLLVHTEGTDGGLYGASVNRSESRTITVELLEARGSEIAGEARLYVNRPRDEEGALDQVEFVGRAGEPTAVYNRSYEPVRGPWAEEPYAYENASVGGGSGLLGDAIDSRGDVPVVGFVIGVVVVLGVLLWRWG